MQAELVAVERAGLIERVAQRVLELSLHERGVDSVMMDTIDRGDGDGNGQRQQAAHDRAADAQRSPLCRAGRWRR